ncbi:hypothetical protein, partial [Pelomonas sp. KK5]|uniref:beta strand repeat-containing protein n=1 Tax=Pelomonas sp. KK5 TaxID=1855730 RepID=UPI001301AC7C
LASSGGAIQLGGNVVATSFTASAAGAFTQAGTSEVAAGSGAIGITAAGGDLSAGKLVTTGAVTLSAPQGALSVAGVLSGADGQRIASLLATGRDRVSLNGALVAGTSTLNSEGTIDTTAATLDSTGAVALSGGTAVLGGAIVTPAAVSITSGGAASLAAVAASAGVINASTAKAGAVTVGAAGEVTLGGLAAASLQVSGTGSAQRAGATHFGDGGVFSSGDVSVNAGAITLGRGGIKSGGTLTLTAAGDLGSGDGRLESAGAATLSAGGALTLRSGGLEVTGAHAAALHAGGLLTVNGPVKSAASVELVSSGADIQLNGNVDAPAGFTASAAGAFGQAQASAVAAGSGAISITTTAGQLAASNLLGTGAVVLRAEHGALSVGGALAGGSAGQQLASLDASAQGNLTLHGALVAGTTTLASGAALDTTAATLQSGGAVTLSGATVSTGAIVSPAAVSVGATGAVVLGPVAGAAGALDAGTARAQSLTVTTPGQVTLGGAAAGSVLVQGPASGSAGGVGFSGASVFAGTGAVTVRASGDIVFDANAGIASGGDLSLASGGAITSGAKLLSATGAATLTAQTTLSIGSGGVSAGGALTLSAHDDLVATGPIKTFGGSIVVQSVAESVTLNELFTWESGAVSSGQLTVNAGKDVTLAKALGGPNTGYLLAGPGYQESLRPQVGVVSISAGRDVELNGLNLDGGSSAGHPNGLSVTAGHRLVSNALIAVNKGDIVLSASGLGDLDGIYLGNSVYSRGLDLGAGGKTAYNITIGGQGADGTRGNLFLFDNTDDFALTGGSGEIAKIVVGNNVANYKTASTDVHGVVSYSPADTLVDAANAAGVYVAIGADQLRASLKAAGPLRLQAMPTLAQVGDLGAAPVIRNDGVGQTNGIGLKVQVYKVAGDAATEVYSVLGTDDIEVRGQSGDCDSAQLPCYARSYYVDGTTGVAYLMDRVSGTRYEIRQDSQGNDDLTLRPRGVSISSYNTAPETGFSDPIFFVLRETGKVGGFVNRIGGGAYQAGVDVTIEQSPPTFDSNTGLWTLQQSANDNYQALSYKLSGSVVQTSAPSDANHVTRILIGPGTLQTEAFDATFNTAGGLNGGQNGSGASNTTIGNGSNSNAGFQSVGSFGGQGAGSAAGLTGNGAATGVGTGSFGAGSASAAAGNGSSSGTSFGGLLAGSAGGNAGN